MFLGAACPTGCDKNLETIKVKMGGAEVSVYKVPLLSNFVPTRLQDKSLTGETPKTTRTSVCHEIKTIGNTLEDKDIAIFVDANAAKDGSGKDWDDAMKSIRAALKKAFDIRQQLLSQGSTEDKPIYVLVAAATYSLTHERTVRAAPGFGVNSSIINFEGDSPFYHNNIKVLGGYLPKKDPCLQLEKNDPNYRNDRSRDTILDGEGTSNNVVNIKGQAEGIAISDFIVRNGNAAEVKLDDPNKLLGGAVIIHGGSHHITLNNIIMENSRGDKGACLAIFGTDANSDTPHDITLTNVTASRCISEKGGGGVYIGGDAYSITTKNGTLDVDNSKALGTGSLGGGILFADDAGVQGEIAIAGNIIKNEADKFGGGIAIIDNAQNISFNKIRVDDNEVIDADGEGGGVYIKDTPLDRGPVKFANGSISRNKAGVFGGGVMVSNIRAPGTLEDPMPAPRISFASIKIDGNELSKNDGSAKGAGLMLSPGGAGAGDVSFVQGSISGNKAEGAGVGLAILGNVHHVLVQDVTIEANEATTKNIHDGEGVYIAVEGTDHPSRIAFIGGSIKKHGGGRFGAGLFATEVIKLTIRGVTFDDNHSDEFGGALFVSKSNILHGGNIYTNNTAQKGGGGFAISQSMDDLLGAVNQPFGMANIICRGNTANAAGGCGFIEGAPGTAIIGSEFTDNGKPNGSSVPNGVTEGGAIYFKSFSVDGLQTLLAENFPVGDLDHAAKLTIEGSNFQNNAARQLGGAVFTEHVFDLKITVIPPDGGRPAIQTQFGKNTANAGGGAVMINSDKFADSNRFKNGARVDINGAKFESNSTNGPGGAVIFPHLNQLTVEVTRFDKNSGKGTGGGAILAFFQPSMTSRLYLGDKTSFAGNSTDGVDSNGGAVLVSASPNTVELYSNFTDNTASGAGGGLYLGANTINQLTTSEKTTFQDNTAKKFNGGGLLVKPKVNILGSFSGTYKTNKAPLGKGGGVAFESPVSQANNDTFRTERATFDGNEAPNDPSLYLSTHLKKYYFAQTKFLNHHRGPGTCGGALTLPEIDEFKFQAGEIISNSAPEGGAICIDKINAILNFESIWDGADTHFVQVRANQATSESGGVISVKNGSNALDVVLEGSTFTGNSAQKDGGVLAIPEAKGLTLASGFYNNSSAVGNGGVLAIPAVANLIVRYSLMSENTANLSGGAVFINTVSGDVSMSSESLNELYQHVLALSLRLRGFDRELSLLSFRQNQALNGDGGAFYLGTIGGSLTLNHPAWLNNRATKGNGGALFVNSVGGDVSIDSGLMYWNHARNGGALYIGDLNKKDFAMTHDARFSADFLRDSDPKVKNIWANQEIEFFEEPQRRIANANEILPAGQALYEQKRALIAGRGLAANTRGFFLVEKNEASTGNGGAFFINNAQDIKISKIPFGANKALQGIGGSIYATLDGQAEIKDTIFYGGEAGRTGGGLYLEGLAKADLSRVTEISFEKSSIQKSKVTIAANDCAGGVHFQNLKSLLIGETNFYDNEVHSQNNANICAGGFRWTQPVAIAGAAADINNMAGLPMDFQNNTIQGQYSAASRGTALIPSTVWDAASIPLFGPLLSASPNAWVGALINNVPPPSVPVNEARNVIGRGP